MVQDARVRLLAVLPLVRPGADPTRVLPEIARPLNAQVWDDEETACIRRPSPVDGAQEERRLFALIVDTRPARSHYSCGVTSANVVRRIPGQVQRSAGGKIPATYCHRTIGQGLCALLEDPSAVGSTWVQHVVAFSLSHTIALLAIHSPAGPVS